MPIFGTARNVSTSSSSQPGRISVSLFRKNRYFPRASFAAALQERTKPRLPGLRTTRTAPENSSPASSVSSVEQSSWMITSKLVSGRCSVIDLMQL